MASIVARYSGKVAGSAKVIPFPDTAGKGTRQRRKFTDRQKIMTVRQIAQDRAKGFAYDEAVRRANVGHTQAYNWKRQYETGELKWFPNGHPGVSKRQARVTSPRPNVAPPQMITVEAHADTVIAICTKLIADARALKRNATRTV